MRVTQVLNLRRKAPVRRQYETSYFIPFQPLHPLELIDRFDKQQKNDNARPCVPQLTVLLQCFKDSDFSQKICAESLKAYYSCVADHEAQRSSEVKNRKLTDVKSVKNLTKIEATQLLKTKPIK